MDVLIFHGYLLGATGSNVYNLNVAKAMVGAGHRVHLFCQDPEPERYDFIDSVYGWQDGVLTLLDGEPSQGAGCSVYRPDIQGLLPVYVYDTYSGFQVKTFLDLSEAELQSYLKANIDAVTDVVQREQIDFALANHAVAGPAILQVALQGLDVPYLVKIHGSALEYVVSRSERYRKLALQGLSDAKSVLVGSDHIARRTVELVGDSGWPVNSIHTAPPGVDTDLFKPVDSSESEDQLLNELVDRLKASKQQTESSGSSFSRDTELAAQQLSSINLEEDRLIGYVGKLIHQKGVDLLITALPLVLQQFPNVKLVVTGFGDAEAELKQLVQSLTEGSLDSVERLLDQVEDQKFTYLKAFIYQLRSQPERQAEYLEAAQSLSQRVLFVGRLEHQELTSLLPLLQTLVVPSTFPEAFGMVSAEAAACGTVPICANHSGLAEVATSLAAAVPDQAGRLLTFELGEGAIDGLAKRMIDVLSLTLEERRSVQKSLAEYSHAKYSWAAVGDRLSQLSK